MLIPGLNPLLLELMEALRCLPGVGPKSAQRMVFHILQRNRQGGLKLSDALQKVIGKIRHCERCQNFTDVPLCAICTDLTRDPYVLCVVGSPADLVAIEQTCGFRGQYFVLMGQLSPMEGLGPEELGLPRLRSYILSQPFKELILATNPTVEGEATAYYIQELLKDVPLRITRIAHGVPLGGELEFVDGGTLLHAITGRISVLES